MTKEELLSDTHIVRSFNGEAVYVQMMALNKFFESNVVIPKGENRHPFADVLHEWVEGVKIQQSYDGNKWIDMDCVHDVFISIDARIKPSEPVYEYQYATLKTGGDWLITGYLTDDEVEKVKKEIPASYLCLYEKLEFTKRERK